MQLNSISMLISILVLKGTCCCPLTSLPPCCRCAGLREQIGADTAAGTQKRLRWLATGFIHAYNNGSESVHNIFAALGGTPDSNTSANVQRTLEAFTARGTLQDAPRSGRPTAAVYIATRDAEAAANAIRRGYVYKGVHRRYRSWSHAEQKSTACKKVGTTLAQHGVTLPATVMRAINKLTGAGVFMERVTLKRAWTADNVAKRKRVAKKNLAALARDRSYLYRIIQVDSKKFRLAKCLHKRWRLITEDDPDVGLDEPESGLGAPVTINYYAAVNALAGVVAIVFVTGTTGANTKARRQYKVSHYSIRGACDCGLA